jgi:hypothetical protein
VISEYTSEYLVNGQKSKETSDTMDEDGKKYNGSVVKTKIKDFYNELISMVARG